MQKTVVEKATLREKLSNLFRKAKLPSSPALATRILALADNPDTNTQEFASVISMDAALSARLLRMANAAHLGQRSTVTTISRAVKTLGISQVRTAALGFQLVGHLHKIGGCPFEMKVYWQQSALRACLAREFARLVVPALQEEAFLVGLLQDCGILLLVQLLGAKYASLYQDGKISPSAFYKAEQGFSEYNHVEAIAAMAAEWKLPEVIALPLARHHKHQELQPDANPIEKLSAVSYFVGSIVLDGSIPPDSSDPALHDYAISQLGLSDSTIQECFAAASEAYTHTKELLGDTLPEDFDASELLSEANNRLTTAAAEAEIRVRSVAAERANLTSALGEYRERAARDPLTSTLNRGALVDAGNRMINECCQTSTALTILFLDIDDFKKLNDTYGHKAGDDVLVGVARQLTAALSNGGCVGRYGGEEFVMIVPQLTRVDGQRLAQSVVEQVRKIDFEHLNLTAPVTCSLGCVWVHSVEFSGISEMIALADNLMYIAKRDGKNQYRFQAFGDAGSAGQPSSSGRTIPQGPFPKKSEARLTEPVAVQSEVKNLTPPAEICSISPAVLDQMRRVAERLNRDTPRHFVTMRKQPRKELLTKCLLCGFVGREMKVYQEPAFVRNISTGGIGLLANRALLRGDPVEISIPQGDGQLYVTGLVCFCRHIEGRFHDIGIQFTTHSREPIFSHDPEGAVNQQAWLAEALAELRKRGRE